MSHYDLDPPELDDDENPLLWPADDEPLPTDEQADAAEPDPPPPFEVFTARYYAAVSEPYAEHAARNRARLDDDDEPTPGPRPGAGPRERAAYYARSRALDDDDEPGPPDDDPGVTSARRAYYARRDARRR